MSAVRFLVVCLFEFCPYLFFPLSRFMVSNVSNEFYVNFRSGSRGHSGDLSDRSSQRDRAGRGGPSYR